MVQVIDLQFQGHPGTIASFLVETSSGPALVESGPATTLPALEKGLEAHGHALEDIRHVFLTHIHFDHAGAAWRLAESGATIHVHPFGLDHLRDPSNLWKSAKRIFQDAMERLWGEMRAIPASQLHACDDGESIDLGDHVFTSLHTPGHAKHHIAWQLDGKVIFAGDVAGVSLNGGPVQPPCPPPDIDLEAWRDSIARLRSCRPETVYLTHFGAVTEVESLFAELETALQGWCQWMEARVEGAASVTDLIPLFEDYVRKELRNRGLGEAEMADYELANPAFMSVTGLARYLFKKKQ